MGSRAISDDRVGQVLSGQVQGGVSGLAGDSALYAFGPAPTTVSAIEIVHESRQQSAAVSEGVASAGAPQAVVGECAGDAPTSAGPVGFQGETSGQTDPPGGGSNYGYTGENGGGSPMDAAAAGSVLLPPGVPAGAAGAAAPASHIASHAKRKISEMGEVDESPADGGGEEAMQVQAGEEGGGEGAGPGPEHRHGAAGTPGGMNRVPSELAMVVGETEGPGPAAATTLQLGDDCDSNAVKQQQQQQQPGGGADGAAAAGETVRPSDAEILEWENQIKKEEVETHPLIGDREAMASLEAEYVRGSPVFRQKIEKLKEGYCGIRRARGDGNCFFRSFLFGYIEGLLASGDEVEKARVLGRLQELRTRMKAAGYDDFVVEPPLDIVLELLRGVGNPVAPLTLGALESNLRDEALSNYCVFLLRAITSCELKARAEFFAPFIMGLSDLDVDTFCARHVDPMGEESDHVQAVALTDALQVPVRVVYLDRSTALGGAGDAGSDAAPQDVHVDTHDFVPEACAGQPPRVHVLYRPGHYDILYPAGC